MRSLFSDKRFRNVFLLTLSIGMFILGFFPTMVTKSATLEDRMDHFMYPNNRPEKVVYLTFDDGPSKYTLELLDLLDEQEVSAIFFMIGENIDLLPNSQEVLNEVINRGHYIGLHTMTHNMDKLYNSANAPQNFVNEMLEVKQKIYDLTGFDTTLCRPPYGGKSHFKKGHYTALEEAGLQWVDWNVDSLDWAKSSTDDIFNHVVSDFKEAGYPNEVVLLFHEKDLTIQVLPRVIAYYRDLGYTFMPYYEDEQFEFLK